MNECVYNILKLNGYDIGDTIEFFDGYFDNNPLVEGFAWTSMAIKNSNDETLIYSANYIEDVWAMCTTYAIKDSNRNIYGNYKLC